MNFSHIVIVRLVGGVGLGLCVLLSLVVPSGPANIQTIQSSAENHVGRMVEDNGRSDLPPAQLLTDSADSEPKLTSALQTLQYKVELLERGRAFLRTVPDYTARLSKQEVVRGDLLDEQIMLMKFRHSPSSVYLLWLAGDVGREVIYAEGANGGKLIAHDGGWKARLPAISLPPDSWLAMRDARYPVTAAGLLGLIDIMDGIHAADLARGNFVSCEYTHEFFDNRPCRTFTTRYESREASPIYRKSITMIDQEWNVPLYTRHFEWPKVGNADPEDQLDQATLIESYTFTDIAFHQQLTDGDFDSTNEAYQFH